jgi:hypothetical protein
MDDLLLAIGWCGFVAMLGAAVYLSHRREQ